MGGGIFTDGGALLFPLTYILGDVLAEVYGLRQARRAIWVGFALAALASLTFLVVEPPRRGRAMRTRKPSRPCWASCPRIVLASLAATWPGSS